MTATYTDLEYYYSQLAVFTEKPYGNLCRENGEDAPYSVCGGLPDLTGGGVLYWCYTIEEALYYLKWCVSNGYHDCAVYDTSNNDLIFRPLAA